MKLGRLVLVVFCAALMTCFLTGCGSQAKTDMKDAVSAANELLESGDTLNVEVKDALEAAIADSQNAASDEEYTAAAEAIRAASSEYEKGMKQLELVTNPSEEYLIECAKSVPTVTDVEAATEETDANKLLNKPGGYTSYVAMKSNMVEDFGDYYASQSPVEAGADGGAAIEAFATAEDAKTRDEYLAAFDGAGALSSGSHKVVGTLVIRTSTQLTASQQKELEANIIEALTKLDE